MIFYEKGQRRSCADFRMRTINRRLPISQIRINDDIINLTLDPKDRPKSNRRLGSFFESFNITDTDLSHYKNWIGHLGVVEVKHTVDPETKLLRAFVYYCVPHYKSY